MFDKRYFIADLHGRADLLEALISFLAASSKSGDTQFVFLGDVVDRGPDSRRCMDLVGETLDTFPESELIMGNHDAFFLEAIEGLMSPAKLGYWLDKCGGSETLASYRVAGSADEILGRIRTDWPRHVDLLRRAKPMITSGPFIVCHAGINGSLPLDQQHPHDLMWISDGFLDRVDNRMPPVIHGHTPMGDYPVVTENRISLDTGAYLTSRLTTLCLDRTYGKAEFLQTTADGVTNSVVPVVHDRGKGSLMAKIDRLIKRDA